jgi:N6-adenosine-specific RNA methylase IME4
MSRARHSEIPDSFAEMIERMYSTGPKLEMFGRRKPRRGWDAHGNESEAG